MRRMDRDLAQSQRARIAAQRQREGTRFETRKGTPAPVLGRGVASFLYPSGGGEPRRVIMKSFTSGNGRKDNFLLIIQGMKFLLALSNSFSASSRIEICPAITGFRCGRNKYRHTVTAYFTYY